MRNGGCWWVGAAGSGRPPQHVAEALLRISLADWDRLRFKRAQQDRYPEGADENAPSASDQAPTYALPSSPEQLRQVAENPHKGERALFRHAALVGMSALPAIGLPAAFGGRVCHCISFLSVL